jgi:hypothetical protein
MRKSNETFIGHRRYVDLNDQIQSRGGITVAFRLAEGGVEYAHARCNISDNFVKSAGRAKAIGRLDGGHRQFLAIPQEQLDALNPGEVTGLVLDDACAKTDAIIEERLRIKEARMFRRMIGL